MEGFRRTLRRHGVGKLIQRVDVRDSGVVRNVTAARLRHSLTGRRFRLPDRKGKWLVAPTDGPTLLLHFGMTGALDWRPKGLNGNPHDRVIFQLDDGELRYRDLRKLQGIWLADDAESIARILGRQGPDALTIDRRHFDERLRRRRGRLKPVLMNQRVIAGLGNLLTDEILWRARLHPELRTDRLTATELGHLYRAMRMVLRESIPFGRVPARRRWLTAARSAGTNASCPRCGTRLLRATIGGRTTYWCPRCQSAGRL